MHFQKLFRDKNNLFLYAPNVKVYSTHKHECLFLNFRIFFIIINLLSHLYTQFNYSMIIALQSQSNEKKNYIWRHVFFDLVWELRPINSYPGTSPNAKTNGIK